MRPPLALLLALAACGGGDDAPRKGKDDPAGPALPDIGVSDEGLSSGYQDHWNGTWKRGRGNVVEDFDGDGDLDLFSGNPGNESFLIRNLTPPGGPLAFEMGQVLSEEELFYGGTAGDFDNDGDPDLFIAAGANDGPEFDRLWRNDLDLGADPAEPLVDVSQEVRMVVEHPEDGPLPNGTMGARAFDFDNDGYLDIWASNEVRNADDLEALTPADLFGFNQLWLGGPDLGFHDVLHDVGLSNQAGSRHAAIFDFDRDGDFDIFENNFTGHSVFWRNRLAEDGALGFEDITDQVVLAGPDMAHPYEMQSMCSLAVDLDNDGYQDLLRLHRGVDDPLPQDAVFGHQVWMNQGGQGFVEVSEHTGLNARWEDHPEQTVTGVMAWWGVMGCQIGDVDLDGFFDVFMGNGGGGAGEVNTLFANRSRTEVDIEGYGPVTAPVFEDWTPLIDFPPPSEPGEDPAPYPLRTHGTAFADYDGDGVDELGVHNGGPAVRPMEEPNRLYRFELPDPRFLRVELVGDGVMVNRDGVGAWVKATVERDRDGARWELHRVRQSATGFGAQNGPELVFGLGDGDRVVDLEVVWPDGTVQTVDPPAGSQSWLTVER